ncbi:VOC family protein [Pseudohoeflea coraliihabitans]|uniref:VOC family protein n=1 Tax=Pseudohoeflea coraliihabitans TaxID=2860393 RepID=A0ABS6WS15_9HYPH|nr:VOC family protein [Pseudohoeflea sp. DP4N28-3]MBW3098749.1 VOC family protein [Pseudohoeflea sp. DP4N28-3]
MAQDAKTYYPEGVSRVSPYLICRDAAKAIDFYVAAFGAEDRGRMAGPDGKIMHAMILLEGASIMLVDENSERGMRSPQTLGGSASSVHVFVPDVDALMSRAEDKGATVTMPAADQFWGDRFGMLTDPFGHSWSFATHQRVLDADEMRAAAATAFSQDCHD